MKRCGDCKFPEGSLTWKKIGDGKKIKRERCRIHGRARRKRKLFLSDYGKQVLAQERNVHTGTISGGRRKNGEGKQRNALSERAKKQTEEKIKPGHVKMSRGLMAHAWLAPLMPAGFSDSFVERL